MAVNNTKDLSSYLRRGIDFSRVLGKGSYGSIHEVTLNRVRCIAKRIHDILQPQDHVPVDKEDENVVSIKFHQECELMNTLRHPNIVQCLGTHKLDIGTGRSEDMLVMEYMHMDLAQCLEAYSNICLPMKFSILCDVSHGLLHLHSQDPPIIHRDLTASNILLTPDMRAKIADLGVSKIFDLRRIQALRLTQAPGTFAYMPPEALTEEPEYDTKLDIFSFGAVTLYTGTQEFPTVFEVQITPEVLEKKELQLLRRKRWTNKLGSVHPLYPLVSKCLQDDPSMRPSADELCSDIEKLCNDYPWDFKDIMKSDVSDLTKGALAEENRRLLSEMSVMKARHDEALSCVQQKDKEIEDVLMDYTALQKKLEECMCNLDEMQQETKRIHKEKEEYRMEYKQVQREKEEAKHEYNLLQKAMERLQHECKQVHEHLMTVHAAEISEHVAEKSELKKEIIAYLKRSLELEDEVQTLQGKGIELQDAIKLLQTQMNQKCSEAQVLRMKLNKLKDSKKKLQSEAELANAKANIYYDDFLLERKDREVAVAKLHQYEEESKRPFRLFRSRRDDQREETEQLLQLREQIELLKQQLQRRGSCCAQEREANGSYCGFQSSQCITEERHVSDSDDESDAINDRSEPLPVPYYGSQLTESGVINALHDSQLSDGIQIEVADSCETSDEEIRST